MICSSLNLDRFVAGSGLSIANWWLEKRGVQLPDWLVDGIGIIGALMFLAAVVLSARWLNQKHRSGRRDAAARIAPTMGLPVEVSRVPLRDAGREVFEAVESEPVAEFIRLEDGPEAKIDWAINWMLTLDPPPQIWGIEPPSSRLRPLVFSVGEPKLINATDKLAMGRAVYERTVIRRSDVERAIERLKNAVFN
jgi:hypothetical protein